MQLAFFLIQLCNSSACIIMQACFSGGVIFDLLQLVLDLVQAESDTLSLSVIFSNCQFQPLHFRCSLCLPLAQLWQGSSGFSLFCSCLCCMPCRFINLCFLLFQRFICCLFFGLCLMIFSKKQLCLCFAYSVCNRCITCCLTCLFCQLSTLFFKLGNQILNPF